MLCGLQDAAAHVLTLSRARNHASCPKKKTGEGAFVCACAADGGDTTGRIERERESDVTGGEHSKRNKESERERERGRTSFRLSKDEGKHGWAREIGVHPQTHNKTYTTPRFFSLPLFSPVALHAPSILWEGCNPSLPSPTHAHVHLSFHAPIV